MSKVFFKRLQDTCRRIFLNEYKIPVEGFFKRLQDTTLFSLSSQIHGHPPSIPSFLETQIVYIGYGQF
jgi:hypothetical protein